MIKELREIFNKENKYRIVLISISVVFLLLLLLSRVLKFSGNIGICNNNGLCESSIFYGIWLPFYNSIFYIFISTFVLIFFASKTFKLWSKIMIPISVLFLFIIITTPDICGGMICFDRTLVASGLSKVFLILTILILIIKSIYDFFVSKNKKFYK